MTINFRQPAFALFGSAARGDHDMFSDRDLLIVSDDNAALRANKAKYEAGGWSCTAYSWSRLQDAASQGSLFVQHLKQEAKILSDPSDRLAELLTRFSTRASYRREASGAASLLGDLLQHLPRCDAGPMWTLDVLAVGYRSLAVANLADNGIFEFSNSGIIDGLTRIGIARKEDKNQLSSLRRFKSLYRRGVLDTSISWFDVFESIRLIDRIFALGLNARCSPTIEILELALVNHRSADIDSDWYARCRRIESALWMMRPRRCNDRAQFRRHRQKLFRIVKSPQSYAWHFTGGYESMQADLTDLAEICAV